MSILRRLKLKTVNAWFIAALAGFGVYFRFRQTITGIPADRYSDSYATVAPSLQLAESWRNGMMALDPGVYFYPTLYTYLLAGLYLFFKDFLHPEFIGRVLTSFFSLLAFIPAYFLGKALMSRAAGLIASAFVLLGFCFVKEGRYPTPDSLQMTIFAFGMWILFRNKELVLKDMVVSGALFGLATGAKWTAAIFCFPFVALLFLQHGWRRKMRAILKPASGFVLAAIFGFLVSTPIFITKWRSFVDFQLMVLDTAGPGIIGAPAANLWSYLFSPLDPSYFFPYWPSLRTTMGLLWSIGVAISVGFLFYDGVRTKNVRWITFAGGIVVAYLIASLGLKFQGGRIILPLTFCFAVSISIFLDRISRATAVPAARIIIPGIFLFHGAFLSFSYARDLRNEDTRLAAAHWILGAIPAKSKILNFINGPSLPGSVYEQIQWPIFESRRDVMENEEERPSIERLRAENINWIIWNEVITRRINHVSKNPIDNEYLGQWREFKNALDGSASMRKRYSVSGRFSPAITIYQVMD